LPGQRAFDERHRSDFRAEQFPAVGGHGAEMRISTDSEAVATMPPPMDKELEAPVGGHCQLSPGISPGSTNRGVRHGACSVYARASACGGDTSDSEAPANALVFTNARTELAMAANRRFNSLSIGGAWVHGFAVGEIRIRAVPPTPNPRAKTHPMSFRERPLTSARARSPHQQPLSVQQAPAPTPRAARRESAGSVDIEQNCHSSNPRAVRWAPERVRRLFYRRWIVLLQWASAKSCLASLYLPILIRPIPIAQVLIHFMLLHKGKRRERPIPAIGARPRYNNATRWTACPDHQSDPSR